MSIAERTSRLVGLDMVAHVAAATATSMVRVEGLRGCDPRLAKEPVDLEPPFADESAVSSDGRRFPPRIIERPVVLKAWCPRDLSLNWKQCNDLHKELAVLSCPIAFEIIGNSAGIWVQMVVDRRDLLPVKTGVEAEFPDVRLEELGADPLAPWLARQGVTTDVEDYFPRPPYYRTMTIHETIGGSPLDTVYVALRELGADEIAVFRVLSVPTRPDHDWHRRINQFTDAEYKGTQDDFFNPSVPNYYHQVPSQYLPMISQREEQKAHPDRPFFAVAAMTFAMSPNPDRPTIILRTLRTALSHFLYGTRPLCYQNRTPFLEVLGTDAALRRMLAARVTHRNGMILNSLELSGLFHFPPGTLMEGDEEAPLQRIKGFEVHESIKGGRLIVGHNDYMGADTPVGIPDKVTNEHIYLIGKSGVGKSTEELNIILQEIRSGRGVGLIEPHGDLTRDVLKRIPPERIQDVAYFDPHDEEYVPCLNPFDPSPHEDKGRLADEITNAFRAGLDTWGPRMENILRQACYALLHLPGATMADVGVLLSQTREGDSLRTRVLRALTNVDAVRFWRDLFPKYKADALDPVTNKISRLMLNTKIAAVFSQRRALIRWRDIIDQGRIFLANLTGLGPSNAAFLGSLFIAGFKEAAISRGDIPEERRRPYSLHIDEFHRFPTTSIEDLLVESRKFAVSLRLAHQETGQIDYPTRRAVGTADTVIAFGVDADDAKHIVRELRKEVAEEDLLALGVGHAFARINNRIVDIRTLPPLSPPTTDVTAAVIAASRSKYYIKRTDADPAVQTHQAEQLREFDTFDN
jgi:hypothetical protein